MDKKYFTNKTYIILCFVILSFVNLFWGWMIWEIDVFWFFTINVSFLCLDASTFWGYPVVTDDAIVHKIVLFGFYSRRWSFSSIDKIEVQPYGMRHPLIIIHLKGKKWKRIHSICCMSVRSVKPFVEELRSKGVTVECEPYELDGRMIYL